MVRLKVETDTKKVQAFIEISIPYGAIKRKFCNRSLLVFYIFQFLMVRLKAILLCNKHSV